MNEQQVTSPLVMRKSVTVKCTPEHAFQVFTAEMETWWPLATHSVTEKEAKSLRVEEGEGGRIVEVGPESEEHVWGTITTWDPPARLVFTWHPGRGAETAQEVDVRFLPDGDSTRVELAHRGWEALGDDAPKMFESYDKGWDFVLGERFVAGVSG
jgi:uncharacterized protein YndB with AHSA1/START domain